MELEELKDIWKKTASPEGYFINKEDMKKLIRKKSKNAVLEVKGRIKLKAMMSGSIALMLVLISIYVFTSNEPVFDFFDKFSDSSDNMMIGIFYVVFGGILSLISITHFLSYKYISQVEKNEPDLKTSISSVLQILQRAMNVKIYSDTIVVPATVISMVIVTVINGRLTSNTGVLIGVLVFVFAFSVFNYFYTKRGQEKRYGSQISELKSCLTELEEH